MRRRKQVAILGCGPAGLFAAQAAAELGYTPVIISKRRKSHMFGAQYLHMPVPDLVDPGSSRLISYTLRGSIAQYRTKVYGPNSVVSVSPMSLIGHHMAWDIRAAYDEAWDKFNSLVMDMEVDATLLKAAPWPARTPVIWSIPIRPLCQLGHTFAATEVWAKGDAPELGEECPVTAPPFTVVCNGEVAPAWYRASNVYGYRTAEWPLNSKPPIPGVARLTKPISNNCTCWTRKAADKELQLNALRVGRYGRWEKGELSHQAYQRVLEWLG